MYYLNLITELWTLSRSSFLLYTQEKKKSFGKRSLQNIPQYLQNPESLTTGRPFISAVTLMVPDFLHQQISNSQWVFAVSSLRFLQQH